MGAACRNGDDNDIALIVAESGPRYCRHGPTLAVPSSRSAPAVRISEILCMEGIAENFRRDSDKQAAKVTPPMD